MKKIFYMALGFMMLACAQPKEDKKAQEVAPTKIEQAKGERVEMLINSQLVDCMGVGPRKCMQVKYLNGATPSSDWELFYDQIEGFTFEPGNTYKLLVDKRHLDPKEVPADASSIAYKLVKVVEKTPQSK